MGRIMAIDFGTKRMGIAVTDPLKIIATNLTTIYSKDAIKFLRQYFKTEEVECVVVGNPGSGGWRKGQVGELSDKFCAELKEKFPSMKIERIDEFYTSKIAERSMRQMGINKTARRNKSLIDKISATIILQSYLEKK